MELKDLKVGMKVRITTDKDNLYGIAYKKYSGDVVTITSIDENCVYVKENNLNWLPWQLEPITEMETDSKFAVIVKTIEEIIEAFEMFGYPSGTINKRKTAESYLKPFHGTGDRNTLVLTITKGKYSGWCNLTFYKDNSAEYGGIYTLAEIKADKKEKQLDLKVS